MKTHIMAFIGLGSKLIQPRDLFQDHAADLLKYYYERQFKPSKQGCLNSCKAHLQDMLLVNI